MDSSMLRHCERSEAISCRRGPLCCGGGASSPKSDFVPRKLVGIGLGRRYDEATTCPEERGMLDFEECDSAAP